jgi:photosystem II stability/assembly factor-like uncharacterized protein
VAESDPGPIHVHGLGVNPADRALFIATHTGMYRVSADETEAQPVTNRYQDTMGFTIIGKNRFLGSGHPDPTEAREKGLPPLLGLIESRDAGRAWRPISLLGEADFHVLRSAGNLVYGYDATNERLLLSRNAGRTWLPRTAPAPLFDLVVDPGRPAHVIASAPAVLFESFDGGKRWEVSGTASGYLTWPAQGELFIVQGSGDVLRSGDSGRRWVKRGSIGGEPAAVLGRAANDLYVALHDGTIKRSVDGGRSWSVRSRP